MSAPGPVTRGRVARGPALMRVRFAVGAIVLLAMVGCAARTDSPGSARPPAGKEGAPRGAAPNTPRASPTIEPSTGPAPLLTTADSGLEVHWWVAQDTDGAVGRALAGGLAQPLPSDPVLRARWDASGLRLVRLPIDQFPALQQRLVTVRSWHRRWIGWTSAWTDVFRGRRTGGRTPVVIDGARRQFASGTLRILARAWAMPPRPGEQAPLVRLEVAFQHQPDAPESADPFEPPATIPEAEAGEVFRALTLELSLEPDSVYVLTAEAPGVVWSPGEPEEAPSERLAAENPAIVLEPGEADASAVFGPASQSPRTLGQAMLTGDAPSALEPPLKALVAFLPRAPRRLWLVP